MGLVEVSEIGGETGGVVRFTRGNSFRRFMNSVSLEHPLRTHPDVLAEPPLERSRGDAMTAGKVADVARCVELEHVGNDPQHQRALRVGRGHPLPEEGLDLRDVPVHVWPPGDQPTLELIAGDSEQVRERERAAYQPGG